MYWKLDDLGYLLQDYCKEGNFGFQLLFIEEIKLIGSNQGTKGYALAYIEGRLGKAKTAEDGLYHFLLAVFT